MPNRQIVVIGLGRFGSNMARTLYQMGHDVLAIDEDEEAVQEMMGQVTYPVTGDATSEAVLRELGVPNFDTAVVAIGSNIQASIMATVLLKTLGVSYIVARANNELHGATLDRLGANRVVYPEQEMGVRLAHTLFHPNVMEYMELAPGYGISKSHLPDGMARRTLKESGLGSPRERNDLAIIAIRRGKEIILTPDEEEQLRPGDLIIVSGRDELLEKLRHS